jgi:predicted PurR-regulated permease PerM
VLIAAFLAVALSGPVNWLNQWMKRGFAILLVYLGLLAIPIGIAALIVPPLVNQGNNLIHNLPEYAQDLQDFAQRNSTLRSLEEDYNITQKLQEQAEKLPARIGDAASVLGALVAIPVAASVQIAIREWYAYRHDQAVAELVDPDTPEPPPPATAPAQ